VADSTNKIFGVPRVGKTNTYEMRTRNVMFSKLLKIIEGFINVDENGK